MHENYQGGLFKTDDRTNNRKSWSHKKRARRDNGLTASNGQNSIRAGQGKVNPDGASGGRSRDSEQRLEEIVNKGEHLKLKEKMDALISKLSHPS